MAREEICPSICPSPKELELSGPVHCPIEGCGKELPSSSCLRMHVTRRHQGKPLAKEPQSLSKESSVAFYCPVRSCNRSKEGGKPFPRLGQLKQHYQTKHGEKSYSCKECGKRFALRDVCSRHEQECREKIVCSSCGLDFRSRNALYQHAKRKGHTLPASRGKVNRMSKPSNPAPALNVIFVPVPTSIKLVVPVPKQSKVVSSSTQTDEEVLIATPTKLPVVELQSSSSQTTPSPSSSSSFNHAHLLCSPSELLSLGTQTNFSPPPPPPGENTSHTSLMVPTIESQSVHLCDFGTQTNTDGVSTPVALGTSSVPTVCSSAAPDVSYSSHEPSLDLVEFGTQTSLSSRSYVIGESDTVDFGTQTIGMSDLEMDDALFCRNLLPPECLDFGTQTLDFPYDCSSHSMHVCPHNSSSDTRDQSSQT